MEPLDGETVCPHCGYDQNTISLANYLKPGKVLHERFLIGKMLSANGEGVTYIAYDESVGCKVLLREYFPERLCTRLQRTGAISVKPDHLAQYKALMAEYTELNKGLARLRNLSHLNPAIDMFAENNTTYAVYEYLEGGTLLEYLKENAGELSWNIVRRIFPPLFTTLSLLHNAGILHRGLSPETILVTDKGEIKLSGFCISAVRTNDTELDAELFDGYAAPEQYFADRQQGTWTDVYGICAVLYRILTGCRATDAISRQDYDILVPPSELNPQVPDHVSQAIMKGLTLDSNQRVRTITDLVTLLFEADEEEEPTSRKKEDTAVFVPARETAAGRNQYGGQQRRPQQGGQQRRPQQGNGQRRPNGNRPPQHGGSRSAAAQRSRSQQNRRPQDSRGGYDRRREDEISIFERVRAPLLIAFLFIAIITILVIAFIHIWGMSAGNQTNELDRERSSSTTDNVVSGEEDSEEEVRPDSYVPDLVGKNYQIKRDEMAGWLDLEPEFEFRDDYLKDTIFWQEFEPNSEFVSGSKMKVKVSLGSSIIALPEFDGQRVQAYVKKLEEMGFVAAIDGGNDRSVNFSHQMGGTTQNGQPEVTTVTNKYGKQQSVIYKAKVDYNYANGYVCAVEPPPLTVIDAMDDYEIIVYYAYNPINETFVNGSGTTFNGTANRRSTTTRTTSTTRTSSTRAAAETEAPHNNTTAAPVTTAQQPIQTLPPDPPVQQPQTQQPVQQPDPPVQQPEGGGEENPA